MAMSQNKKRMDMKAKTGKASVSGWHAFAWFALAAGIVGGIILAVYINLTSDSWFLAVTFFFAAVVGGALMFAAVMVYLEITNILKINRMSVYDEKLPEQQKDKSEYK